MDNNISDAVRRALEKTDPYLCEDSDRGMAARIKNRIVSATMYAVAGELLGKEYERAKVVSVETVVVLSQLMGMAILIGSRINNLPAKHRRDCRDAADAMISHAMEAVREYVDAGFEDVEQRDGG